MNAQLESDFVPGQPGVRFDPYVRLTRSLLPRTACVAMFGASGELAWSSEPMIGPDLMNIVDDGLIAARAQPDSAGQTRMLGDHQPVYLCPLRDDAQQLLALLVVVAKGSDTQDRRNHDFSFAYSLLAPMLECLRRDLVAHATIEELTETLGGLDKDLNLLLAQGNADAGTEVDSGSELPQLLQQTIDHLRAVTGALLVPEKSVTLVRGAGGTQPDTKFLMRAHRRLLALAQAQREPLLLNETTSPDMPEAFPYRVLCCPLRSRTGRFLGLLALVREPVHEPFSERDAHIAAILARKAMAAIESSYDALSGLYTRAALERRVRGIVADLKADQPWSALYIDCDQLHAVNEKCGMHVGDALLGQLGELIRQRLPPGAFGARLSGDRFVVMLPARIRDAERFAESLREGCLKLAFTQGESHPPVSISVGVATLDSAQTELAHLLAAAETACKAAKDRGRNRVEVYHHKDASIMRRHADVGIAAQLREAIEAGRLHLDAQLILPFAAAESARPHYELLLRVTDDVGRTMGPDTFLSAANRYQLMPAIDRWVVNHVIEALKPRAAILEGKALGFAINFSGQSLNDDHFADTLIEMISSSGLDPELFCFELTENATVANLPRAEALMRRLRKLGCGVALDDFGTGLSSLSCLRQLPVTMLKIDGSFVRDVMKDPRAESMVRAIAELARGMSITTVAEYVETDALAVRMAELGVDYGQGFAIGRPIPLADLLTELPLPDAPAQAATPAPAPAVEAPAAAPPAPPEPVAVLTDPDIDELPTAKSVGESARAQLATPPLVVSRPAAAPASPASPAMPVPVLMPAPAAAPGPVAAPAQAAAAAPAAMPAPAATPAPAAAPAPVAPPAASIPAAELIFLSPADIAAALAASTPAAAPAPVFAAAAAIAATAATPPAAAATAPAAPAAAAAPAVPAAAPAATPPTADEIVLFDADAPYQPITEDLPLAEDISWYGSDDE